MAKAIYISGVVAMAFVALAGCTTNEEWAKQYAENQLARMDPGHQEIGDWLIICPREQVNSVGKRSGGDHCRVEKRDFASVVRVDSDGVHVHQPGSYGSACNTAPYRVAVDKEPIQSLTTEQKINRMKSGRVFATEYMTPWPECWVLTKETSLDQFGHAYDTMMMRWKVERQ